MPKTIRIHLDENYARGIAIGLRSRGIDVTTTFEVGLREASDEKQLEFALTDQRVLVSHDADLVKLHRSGMAHYGVIYSPITRRSIGEMIEGIVLIWEIYERDEMIGRLEFL